MLAYPITADQARSQDSGVGGSLLCGKEQVGVEDGSATEENVTFCILQANSHCICVVLCLKKLCSTQICTVD
jgi:hypothetical protein